MMGLLVSGLVWAKLKQRKAEEFPQNNRVVSGPGPVCEGTRPRFRLLKRKMKRPEDEESSSDHGDSTKY